MRPPILSEYGLFARGSTRGAQLFPKRYFAARALVLLLFACACFGTAESAQAKEQSGTCEALVGLAVLASPMAPWKGAPLRVVFATEKQLDGELSLTAPDGSVAVRTRERHGGPPYFWLAEVKSPAKGTWHATLTDDGGTAECSKLTRKIMVSSKPQPPSATQKSVWPVRAKWDRATENLYSAWIETLFDAPLDATLSWKALHEGLRDPSRNILFNHLSLREDEKKLVIRPDCADLPYFLRAYFAFKMGLPFGYATCTRGGHGEPPRCDKWWNLEKEEPPPAPPRQQTASGGPFGLFDVPPVSKASRAPQRPRGLVPGFGYYLSTTIADAVHSGSGRTALDDDRTDYYPVPLKPETLRPGTVYADPYGHTLVIAKRIAQTKDTAGMILAVDAQPDGTVARKRYWRGNFLFAHDPALGGPGFKRFRPVVDIPGGLRRLTNAEIAKDPEYGDFSLEQSQLAIEDFYDRMDDVMSPAPLDPMRAMKEAIAALDEQVNARVTSLENGRKYHERGGGQVAMPEGASIFETTGAWEDFATPARDLRLLIAIDVVRKFPERVARRPERYAMPAGKSLAQVKVELENVLAAELAARKFSYTRSDGSKWQLTLKDVLDRIVKLEMAYNINDCVEHRWGAPEGSEEAATCKRHAPSAQREKMTSEYRAWFQERRRPPRG
jgi:hypothetical protein